MELKPGWPCFFCLNPVIFERQQNGPRERVPYSNLNRIFKYLKLPLPPQVKLEKEDGGNHSKKSTEEFIVPLCKVCLEVTGKLTGLCAELELIQMKIDYQLELFRGQIAVKEEETLREDVEEEIRRRTKDRCSKLLKRCLPRVKLRRIDRGVKEDGLDALKTKTVDPLEIVQVDMDMSSFPINLQESEEDLEFRTEQRTNKESIGAVDKGSDNRKLMEYNAAETEVNNSQSDHDVTVTPPPPKIRIKVTKGYKFAITRVSGPRKRDRNRISRRIPLRTKLWGKGKGKHKLQNSLFKNDVDTQHYHYCPHCGTEFISKPLLQNHIEMHCTFVKKQEVQESRNNSSSSHITLPSLAIKNCDKCNTIFTCEKALKRHIHNCHPETYFMALKHPDITMAQFETICEYQLSSERGLFKKMEVAQETGVQLLYECPYCSKSIDILQFASSHLIENHHSLLASRIKIQVEKAVEKHTENHSVPKVAMVESKEYLRWDDLDGNH